MTTELCKFTRRRNGLRFRIKGMQTVARNLTTETYLAKTELIFMKEIANYLDILIHDEDEWKDNTEKLKVRFKL